MKEDELAVVRKEIEALRIAAPLLSEDGGASLQPRDEDPDSAALSLEAFGVEEDTPRHEPSSEHGEEVFDVTSPKRNRLRDWLGRAVGE